MNGFIKRNRQMIKKKIAKMLDKAKAKLDAATEPHKVQKFYIISIAVAAVLSVVTTVFGIYVNDYYHQDGDAIYEAIEKYETVGCFSYEDGVRIYRGEGEIKTGFIFYPGGKVEYTAYEPLMYALADRGILCVLIEMPFNLAVLDVNAADKIADSLPEIEHWYIGGHSLGGSMAASYLAKHTDEIDGLVLLGSYSTEDLSDSRVLSIFGSEDGVMNREKYEKYKGNLPDGYSEHIIEGGNHAYFGMYGEQDGDGKAAISNIEQIEQTAEQIAKFIVTEK